MSLGVHFFSYHSLCSFNRSTWLVDADCGIFYLDLRVLSLPILPNWVISILEADIDFTNRMHSK